MTNEYNDDRDVKIFSGDSDDNAAPEDSEYVRLINEQKGSRNIRRAKQPRQTRAILYAVGGGGAVGDFAGGKGGEGGEEVRQCTRGRRGAHRVIGRQGQIRGIGGRV